LTFWPGFNPVTVAFAEFLFVEALRFGATTETIFGRAALTFMRIKPKDTCTSLLE
jgi:hypothetical protein